MSLWSLQPHELIVDLFAGGGGASTGIERATNRQIDIAINHDPEAIALHQANHPNTNHLIEDVWQAHPRLVTKSQPVGLLWASPDCKHFSRAKGGKPKDKNIRSLPWVVVWWAAAVRPRVICLENVEEIQEWGPLLNGQPDKSRKGEHFKRFKQRLEFYGYKVEYRTLRACEYGAATTRKRLFMVARCDGMPILWPVATHGDSRPRRHVPASEIIDWTLPSQSIFERKKPLVEATCKRLAKGIVKFVLTNPRPFLVGHELPFISTYYGAKREEDARGRLLEEPLPTQSAENRFALVSPIISSYYGNTKTSGSADKPLPTQTSVDRFALATAFLIKHYGTDVTKMPSGISPDKPLDTITAWDHHGLASILATRNLKGYGKSALVMAFLKHYAQLPESFEGLEHPLIVINGTAYIISDIAMRMLSPRELYRAQGFGDGYEISPLYNGKPLTKKAQVRMVGNSVVPQLAEAIVRVNLTDSVTPRAKHTHSVKVGHGELRSVA